MGEAGILQGIQTQTGILDILLCVWKASQWIIVSSIALKALQKAASPTPPSHFLPFPIPTLKKKKA